MNSEDEILVEYFNSAAYMTDLLAAITVVEEKPTVALAEDYLLAARRIHDLPRSPVMDIEEFIGEKGSVFRENEETGIIVCKDKNLTEAIPHKPIFRSMRRIARDARRWHLRNYIDP